MKCKSNEALTMVIHCQLSKWRSALCSERCNCALRSSQLSITLWV